MTEKDDPQNENCGSEVDDYYQDSYPDDPIGELVKKIIAIFGERQEYLPVDLIVDHMEVLTNFEEQFKRELENKEVPLTITKIEAMAKARENLIHSLDTKSISSNIKRLEPLLIKKKNRRIPPSGNKA